MRTKLRSKVTLLFIVCAALLAFPAIAFAQDLTGSTSPAPTIQSDKADYAPGELVTLTGGGWQPGESVHINVNDDQGKTWSRDVDVTADASGNITDQFQLPTTFVAVYKVTATGAQSGVATTSFTDGNVTVRTSGPTVTLTYEKWSDPNCTGTSSQGTVSINSTSGQIAALAGNAGSVKLSVPATSGTQVFQNWTGTAGAGTSTNNPWCIDSVNGNRTFTAAYATPAVTTTSVSDITASASTFGGTTNLSAKVSPLNSPGSVAFFVDGSSTPAAGTVTYNQSTGVATLSGYAHGLDAKATPYSVNAVFTPSGASHSGSQATNATALTVGKASSTTAVTCPANVPYTGSALTPCSVSVTGAGGLDLSPAVDYSNNTGAGTATASYTFAGDANHTGSNDSKNFTIDKASSTTAVSCTAGPFTYTGSAHTPCSVSVTGAGGLNLSPNPDYSNNVGAGTATASYTFAGDANHNGSNDSKNFTIDKASSTTTVTCTGAPFTYTGNPITPCSANVTGAGGLNQAVTPVSYDNNTGAGTATASASFAGDANHTGSNDSEDFTIDKASSTTAVTCPTSVTYTGSALTPCTASVTGAGGLNLSPAVNYSNNTGAGTATASYTFAGDANHTGSNDSKDFTIDKASSTTAVTCPTSVTYTGSALTPCTANVTGAGGLNQPVPVNYADNTNAGTATASASFAGDANHTGSNASKTFTISFNFTGFSSPVDNNNVLNTAKAGQAIPLKWRLTDASGNPVTNLLSTDVKVTVANYSCGLSTTVDLLEEYAAGSSGLQNLGNGYYQFNWKTPTNYANSCKTMTLDLGEGTLTTPHTAIFKFTK